MTTFPPLNHVAVTVRDLAVSRPWYQALIGLDPVLDEPSGSGFHHIVWVLGNGTVFGIHQHEQAAPDDESFSEHRVGLDHVAFGCANRAELEKWATKLDELNIDHSEIVDEPYGSGLSFRDPDGVALEFFAPPA
jgi:catechol-2,3-dioxygenase